MTEAITVPFGQAMLLDLITEEQLVAMREVNKENPEVVNAINAHLEAKAKADSDKLVLDNFTTSLSALELPLDTPDTIINIYRPRIKETRSLTKGEIKEVLSSNPTLTEEDVNTRIKETGNTIWGAWVLNKALSIPKGGTSPSTSTRKLAITLYKHNADKADDLVGNFRTSKEACVHLGLETKGDSANRVLIAHKYTTDDYDGNDYLVKEA